MVRTEGGTEALRRIIYLRLEIAAGTPTSISVPSAFGALILKAAAFTTDSRYRDRHLFDAAALARVVDDPFAEREDFTGSDRRRIVTLQKAILEGHPEWRRQLPENSSRKR